MTVYLGLTIRLLAPSFHGRQDRGEPEWPPSPLRLMQALVAAAAARDRPAQAGELSSSTHEVLAWLERLPPPIIVAPPGTGSTGYCLSVPNNALDIVAKAWARGNDSNTGDANPATHRTMKTVRPTLLPDETAITYLWRLPAEAEHEVNSHLPMLIDLARSIVAFGWGTDLAIGQAALLQEEEAARVPGERWLPVDHGVSAGLRVPVAGTLDALVQRYTCFVNRLGPDGFTAPPPLTTFATVEYRRADDPPPRPVAAFSLLRLDASGFKAFDPARRGLTVAGMVRHATRRAAEQSGWSPGQISSLVLGHRESADSTQHQAVGPRRFAYLPLPSLEVRGEGHGRRVGSIRRVLVVAYAQGLDRELSWVRRTLSGQELIEEQSAQPLALLTLLPTTDKMVRWYLEPAESWATVTPVVLPGFDDPAHLRRRLKQPIEAETQHRLLERLDQRVDGLLRRAIVQAGFSQELAEHVELEWNQLGFWPGCDRNDAYGVPDHLRKYPRLHVRLRWRSTTGMPIKIAGPLCLGGGRFSGLGLFAAQEEE